MANHLPSGPAAGFEPVASQSSSLGEEIMFDPSEKAKWHDGIAPLRHLASTCTTMLRKRQSDRKWWHECPSPLEMMTLFMTASLFFYAVLGPVASCAC